jgi:hypothetical protein
MSLAFAVTENVAATPGGCSVPMGGVAHTIASRFAAVAVALALTFAPQFVDPRRPGAGQRSSVHAGNGLAVQPGAALGPCLTSSSPDDESGLLAPSDVDDFTVPSAWVLVVVDVVGEVTASPGLPYAVHREPETPPPRAA